MQYRWQCPDHPVLFPAIILFELTGLGQCSLLDGEYEPVDRKRQPLKNQLG